MKTHRKDQILFPFVLLAWLGAGCTHVYKVPTQVVTGYAQTEKIPLTVELRLTDEFRKAKWEKHMMGDTFVIPIGENLCRNSETLTRQLFSGVVVANSADSSAQKEVSAILIPRVAALEQTMGMWAWDKVSTTILLEWTLKDQVNNIVWVDTIKGEAQGSGGNAFTAKKHAQERVKAMIDDAFHRSHQAISSAQEIRKFRRAGQPAQK